MAKFLRALPQIHRQVMKKVSAFRSITTTQRIAGNYEGDGKMTVTIVNQQYKNLLMIDSFSNYGFRLNNGIFVLGPMAVFPRTILQWNVSNLESLTPESFSLFALLEPKLDIFILGMGDKCFQLSPTIHEYFKSKKISTEILTTEKAIAAFNFLNAEGRCVAGALLPPAKLNLFEDDLKFLDTQTSNQAGFLM